MLPPLLRGGLGSRGSGCSTCAARKRRANGNRLCGRFPAARARTGILRYVSQKRPTAQACQRHRSSPGCTPMLDSSAIGRGVTEQTLPRRLALTTPTVHCIYHNRAPNANEFRSFCENAGSCWPRGGRSRAPRRPSPRSRRGCLVARASRQNGVGMGPNRREKLSEHTVRPRRTRRASCGGVHPARPCCARFWGGFSYSETILCRKSLSTQIPSLGFKPIDMSRVSPRPKAQRQEPTIQ